MLWDSRAMSEVARDEPSTDRWRIPYWYRRVGLVSWFFLGIVAAIGLLSALIAATSEITAPLVLGAFLAVVFLPAVDWLARHRFPRSLAAMTVLIGLARLSWLSAGGGVFVQVSPHFCGGLVYYPGKRVGV